MYTMKAADFEEKYRGLLVYNIYDPGMNYICAVAGWCDADDLIKHLNRKR